jgi:hypothetical protein
MLDPPFAEPRHTVCIPADPLPLEALRRAEPALSLAQGNRQSQFPKIAADLLV